MASFNKVILLGNLTRDPELRVTPKGTSVCQFSLAVNSSYKDKDGNAREEVTFVDIDCFGRQAELIAKHLNKGRPLLVEGRLKMDEWETKEGEKRRKLKVVLDNFQFVGSRKDGESDDASEAQTPSPAHTMTRNTPAPRGRPGELALGGSARGGGGGGGGLPEDDVPFAPITVI